MMAPTVTAKKPVNQFPCDAWKRARECPSGNSWAVPAHLTAESFMADGRPEDASKAADDAVLTAPSRATVIVTWFETHAARIQKGSAEPPSPAFILSKLEEALPKFEEASGGPAALSRST